MITPGEITDKAQRLYPKFIRAWLAGEDFFPRRVPANLILPRELAAAKRAVELLRDGAKQTRGYGYEVRWRSRNSRSHGLNEFPIAIDFGSEKDFLRTVNRVQEFSNLKSAVGRLRERQPRLKSWLLESTHWKELLRAAEQLDDLLTITQYFVDNPRPDCFAREIPLPVSTKLIEENRVLLAEWFDRLLPQDAIDFRFDRGEFEQRYGLRYARHHILVRCLDANLQRRLGLAFPELSLPVESIGKLACAGSIAFIVENKVNLLTLPPVPDGIAIGGLGRAISLLCAINWLRDVPIYYWGDLDVEGFEMLSQFREMFEHTESMLMDVPTLKRHADLVIPWSHEPGSTPTALTESERATYEHLLLSKVRLEQERIPQQEVNHCLQVLGFAK